jgi:tripeptide aminopeptidase
MNIDSSDLLDRFLRYVQIDTRSDAHSPSTPSTPGQWDLLRLLAKELKELGAKNVSIDAFGYVLATIPATSKKKIPTIAWFAHADTATNLPSAAKPIVHKAYDGSRIVLPDDPTQILSVETTPHLKDAIGKDVITGSGKTLLGADDKGGVSVVMAAVRHLLLHPEIQHGTIRVCFNPDEEIARGVSKLNIEDVQADFAYTLDGETLGEINFETFSADAAVLEIQGVASHPGWAKDVMVNAMRIAGRFLSALPRERAPETTADKQGFIHPVEMTGTAEHASVHLILRDFELSGLEAHHKELQKIVALLQAQEPKARLTLSFQEQYRNMRYWLEKDMRPVQFAETAFHRAGLKPDFVAIRGGTDGSNLTARGLPTPNLFCGMHDCHSQREWIALQDMSKSVECLVHLAQVWAE